MPRYKAQEQEDQSFSLRFGGGMNTRRIPEDVEALEGTLVKNVDLDIDRAALSLRPPLKRFPFSEAQINEMTTPDLTLLRTPNGEQVQGFAQLLYEHPGSLGTQRVSSLLQAGDKIYEPYKDESTPAAPWKWREIDTIPAGCTLRGTLESNSYLDGIVIITDLSLTLPVQVWDGTTLSVLDHELHPKNAAGTAPLGGFTNFYAKYCIIEDERAWFGNIRIRATVSPENGDPDETSDQRLPHMIVASSSTDVSKLSVSDKPSSALGAGDPFFLLTPDLNPVNGIVPIFGTLVFSSLNGRMYQLTGSSSLDYGIDAFFSGSAAGGDEGMVLAGNDILFVTPDGNVDSLAGVQAFGDVEVDNVSRPLERSTRTSFLAKKCVYNPATNKLYVQADSNLDSADGEDRRGMWVFSKSIHDQQAKDVSLLRQGTPVSPWANWEEQDQFIVAPQLPDGRPTLISENIWVMYPLFGVQDPVFGVIGGPLPEGQKKQVFIGTDEGYCYTLGDREPAKSDFTSRYSEAEGAINSQITMKHRTKVVSSPSGKGFKDFTCQVKYSVGAKKSPDGVTDPSGFLRIHLMGKNVSTHEVPIVFNKPQVEAEYTGLPAVIQMTKNVGIPTLDKADKMQIEIEVTNNGQYVEILGVDFNARA